MISTGPNLVTVRAGVLRGLIGTSPVPAALVTLMVPPGAQRVAVLQPPDRGEGPVIDTGPPTRPSVPGTGPSVLPLTLIAAGRGTRKPKAAGGAALNLLPLGLVA